MKLEVRRNSIRIIPETVLDEAFIEEVLGLKAGNQATPCRRVNIQNHMSIAYLEICKAGGGL